MLSIPVIGLKFSSQKKNLSSNFPLFCLRFISTDIEISLAEDNGKIPDSFPRTKDNFVIIGSFDENGIAEGNIDNEWGAVAFVRFDNGP